MEATEAIANILLAEVSPEDRERVQIRLRSLLQGLAELREWDLGDAMPAFVLPEEARYGSSD